MTAAEYVQLYGAIAATVLVMYGFYKAVIAFDSRYAKSHQVRDSLQAITNEIATARETQGELFKLIRENEKAATDRHAELLRELAKKADRRSVDR